MTDPYKLLANAIIIQAVQDYKNAIKKKGLETIKEVESFIMSEWFHILTDYDPYSLLTKLKEELNDF